MLGALFRENSFTNHWLLSSFLYFLCKTFDSGLISIRYLIMDFMTGLKKWRSSSNRFVLRCWWTTYPRNLCCTQITRFLGMKDLSDQIDTVIVTTIFYRNQKFWFQINNFYISCHFLFSVFVRDRRLTIYTIFGTHQFVSSPIVMKLKRAPDLSQFITYSLLGPLCSASFFKFCLHDPGTPISQ